jgi:hypothetical protein
LVAAIVIGIRVRFSRSGVAVSLYYCLGDYLLNRR